MHPPLLNGITYCVGGEAIFKEHFGDHVPWMPYVDPVIAVQPSPLLDALTTGPLTPNHIVFYRSVPTADASGEIRVMDQFQLLFFEQWEVASYRRKVNTNR